MLPTPGVHGQMAWLPGSRKGTRCTPMASLTAIPGTFLGAMWTAAPTGTVEKTFYGVFVLLNFGLLLKNLTLVSRK